MEEIEFSRWQEKCTHNLKIAASNQLGGKEIWSEFRKINSKEGRVLIADCDLSNQSLKGFDLSHCHISRTNFKNANLSEANLSYTIFRNCDGTNINIEGARFRDTDMARDGLSLETKRFNGRTDFDVKKEHLPDAIDPALINMADKSRIAKKWRYEKSQSKLVKFFLWLTEHGYSLDRLIISGGIIVIFFTVIFMLFGSDIKESFIASLEYFFNSNSIFEKDALRLIGALESLLGLIFFAMFTAILIKLLFEDS